ncbi:EDD domain protein, DegV family [Geosporobacter subterraneus DSM 17957]|uniref:EDD domain protein, DegV family n=1 Tax=Geosporobacter subterraneus DSM 17957 TaxID=1121919 RepID=A0A1M6INI6_9FIRM|nr:DegV family protein [Geosporobacter subterraneus]SHJ35960.1 EDD domain protein, DegV family [Geosporobacter subterraneus DSM 17957]
MSKIQIVTDSTAYIPKEYAQEHNIEIVPLSVNFSGEINDEGFPGEFEEFFQKLKTSSVFPTTSQPSIQAFSSAYEKAIQEGKEIITIVISEKLSGTFNSASVAAQMTAPDKITVVDSETSASNLRLLVEKAHTWAEDGKCRDEIVEMLEQEKKRMGINITVDTLEYLRKGGRLSSTQAFIGSVLNIRPIIGLVEGKLVPIGKARGKSKAVEMMIANIPAEVKQISICHTLNEEEANELKKIMEEKFRNAWITVDELGPVIGAHLGPKAIGICFKW